MMAFEEIEREFFQEQWPKLLRQIKRQFGHQIELEDLENILSTAYLKFREAAVEGRIEKQWGGYWYRAAYNGCIDWLRDRSTEKEAVEAMAEDLENNFVNFSGDPRHTDKSLLKQLLEALSPKGMLGPKYRLVLQEVLSHQENTEGLHQLIEACIGYLANPSHIDAILVQDQAYLGLRHKDAQARLGSSKGGPNRGYELGSKKVLERLKAAFDGHDDWARQIRTSSDKLKKYFDALYTWMERAGFPAKKWLPHLLTEYGDELGEEASQNKAFKAEVGENAGIAFALLYCIDEPKIEYREVVQALATIDDPIKTPEGALSWLKKERKFPQKILKRFFGINLSSKTPRGLEAFRYALQVAIIAASIRERTT